MAKGKGEKGEVVNKLPDDKAIFQNEERPAMMYVGKRENDKPGWKKLTEIPKDRELRKLPTGMFVLAKK